MNRFNLTFSGEILPGQSPEQVRLRFAKMFSIDDPQRLERFFSGESIILRRNLERKEAAQCYQELRELGVAAALVKVTAEQAAESVLATPAPSKTNRTPPRKRKTKAKTETKAKAEKTKATQSTQKPAKPNRAKSATREAQLALPLEAPPPKLPPEDAHRAEPPVQATEPSAPVAKPVSPTTDASGPIPSRIETRKRKPPVRSTLDLPLPARAGKQQSPPVRKRQVGEPNYYQLEPFRNSAAVRTRASAAAALARRRLRWGVGALLVSLLGVVLNSALAPAPGPTQIDTAAVSPSGQLLVLADPHLALHDRAGNPDTLLELADLGLATLRAPIRWRGDSDFLAVGTASTDAANERLIRCSIATSTCSPLPIDATAIVDFAHHPVDDTLFYLDTLAGTLVHSHTSGEVIASAPLDLPPTPRMHLQSGLMFINSAEAPAINVLRYDATAFGKQLDQVLLLPPAAVTEEQHQVTDFEAVADGWWVTLHNPDTGSTGVYRFDGQWSDRGQVQIETPPVARGLTAWGNRVLINTGDSLQLRRFGLAGQGETPFEPAQLVTLANRTAAASLRQATLIRWLVIGSALLALAALLSAWHQRARALVYSVARERGAPPAEESREAAHWIGPATTRGPRFTIVGVAYGLVALCGIALAVYEEVDAGVLTALVVALAGPALAATIVRRAEIGHIGTREGLLMLVDHRGVYHQGVGSQVTYRDNFLLLDDVVVFRGNRLLPAFNTRQFDETASAHVRGGVRVDRKTLWVKLIESGHPLARGALVILSTGALGLAIWLGATA